MFGHKKEQGFGEGRGRRKHIHHHGFRSNRHGGRPRHMRGLGRRDFSCMDAMAAADFIRQAEVMDPADMAINTATCPLCKNHCPMDDPGCKKGEAYFKAMNPEERTQ
ncbi:hypothetical protein [Desulfatibacillum aliphaticivorans]|uniref:hypothetical protein n=1 Tax=Desulfatibacillum aliphaticivorans TaxID=218208 RepID=UPI0004803B0F|nr:hypothetical protein [Desulfatibacillum aliphaticivorans]